MLRERQNQSQGLVTLIQTSQVNPVLSPKALSQLLNSVIPEEGPGKGKREGVRERKLGQK